MMNRPTKLNAHKLQLELIIVTPNQQHLMLICLLHMSIHINITELIQASFPRNQTAGCRIKCQRFGSLRPCLHNNGLCTKKACHKNIKRPSGDFELLELGMMMKNIKLLISVLSKFNLSLITIRFLVGLLTE